MATASYHGAHYTVIDNLPGVGSFLEAHEWGGDVKAITDTFTATSADTGTTGSFIYIGKLPKNSIPLNVIVSAEDAITWGGEIGWANDPDALGDFAAITAVGSKITGPSSTHQTAPLSADKDVYITTITQTIASGDSITTTIFYINAG